ncbi:MAG: NUDIX hydrolase [Candidatus Latescibacterota bacterium]|nr:MAG: NUDIX hydrolase [Candidatus Latescibacterota bacterium]HDI00702.1 NUDIX domain-containing protein [Bacillota bacterium]
MEEMFEVVDEEGRVVGLAPRSLCHSDPELAHRAVHVIVVNSRGELLLQKRSLTKDVQPGRWDTSVGGHPRPGETYEDAARREMAEELGIEGANLEHLYDYTWRSERETELVRTYRCIYDGPVRPDPEEVTEARFWKTSEIEESLGTGVFTPNFEDEFGRYKRWMGRR